jgi:hypothetical protein
LETDRTHQKLIEFRSKFGPLHIGQNKGKTAEITKTEFFIISKIYPNSGPWRKYLNDQTYNRIFCSMKVSSKLRMDLSENFGNLN